MTEIWKDIEGYEGIYQVSNLGRVRSLDRIIIYSSGQVVPFKGKVLSNIKNQLGYHKVNLRVNGGIKTVCVHRLVAKAFIPNPDNLPFINHKDENPSNNRVDNLEWCTPKYNNSYGTRLQRLSKTKTNGVTSKKVYQYTLDGELVNVWPSLNEINRTKGYRIGGISKCALGEEHYNTAYGFKWSYVPLKKEEHKAPPVQLEFNFKD